MRLLHVESLDADLETLSQVAVGYRLIFKHFDSGCERNRSQPTKSDRISRLPDDIPSRENQVDARMAVRVNHVIDCLYVFVNEDGAIDQNGDSIFSVILG